MMWFIDHVDDCELYGVRSLGSNGRKYGWMMMMMMMMMMMVVVNFVIIADD